MDIALRDYEPDRHREAVIRIWREVGWIEKDKEESFDWFVDGSRGHVAEVGGEAESFVLATPGSMRHLATDVPLTAVTAVTTSRVARRLHLAHRLTARALAAAAAEGAAVAALGIFDQGFYDRMGFGTGSYVHSVSFDPAQLRLNVRTSAPVRISSEDWREAHQAKLARRLTHGGCNLYPPGVTRGEMAEHAKAFGLGYRGDDGRLTHYIWARARNKASGPYRAELVYRDSRQFLELLALLGSLADQVRLVTVREPADIQLQDLMTQPFRHTSVTRRGEFEVKTSAAAYWQARILDVPRCITDTHLLGPATAFNLEVTDPLAASADETGWAGAGGAFVVKLAEECTCQIGAEASLPTLQASVGAFTRLWLGVRPATGLAVTDSIRAPDDLLERLDASFRLPDPQPDWDF